MPYRLPVFNLKANVWHGLIPGPITAGGFLPPVPAPDVSPIAQLYLSKYGPGGWFHAWPDDVRLTLERAGYTTLRVPRATDVRAPWLPAAGVQWSDLDVIECPANSGRYYVAVMVEQAHAGFPNEYRVAILAQIADTTPSGYPGDGTWVPGYPVPLDGGGGGGSDAQAVPGGPLLGDGGGGGGSDAQAVPGGPLLGDGGGGGGSDATVTSGGGTGPGSSCAAATLITLPLLVTKAIAGGAEDWWKFAGTAGTTYHIQITRNSGSLGNGNLNTGACGSQFNQASCTGPFYPRQTFVLGSSQTVYIEVQGDLINPGNYTIDVGTGP